MRGRSPDFVAVTYLDPALSKAVEVSDRIAALDLSEQIDAHDKDETGHLLLSLKSMQDSVEVAGGRSA